MRNSPNSSISGDEVNLRDLGQRDGTAAAELIRIRASPSFRLGVLFIRAIEKPLRILRLPWDIIHLIWQIATQSKQAELNPEQNRLRKCIFLISGESMENYRQERSIALASELSTQEEEIELVHLSLGPPMIEERISTLLEYSLPSSRMSKEIWGGFLSEQISLILATHRPSIIVYDGEYPHRGIIRALDKCSEENCIWIDPSNSLSDIQKESYETFDFIVSSSDIFLGHALKANQLKQTPPLFKKIKSQRSKLETRKELDIPTDALTVFFHPPTKPSAKQNLIFQELQQLLLNEKAIICMNPISNDSRKWVGNYPRSLFRRLSTPISEHTITAMDLAITDSSQSMMLKMIDANVPIITIPRQHSRENAELRRATNADSLGCSIMISNDNSQSSSWALRKILNPIKRRRMKENCSQQQIGYGLGELSEWLLNNWTKPIPSYPTNDQQ